MPDFLAPLIDPTAPLPALWPAGAWGAFLLFLIPIGGGIPLGVIMGRDAGLSPLVMAAMYFVSDIFMAVTHEPFFWLLSWLASISPPIAKIRDFFRKASNRAGMQDEGGHGPLGLIIFSFTVDPISGRGAAAAAGHGFFSGWGMAIVGDMMYFAVLMAATLWLSGMFGDDRTTVGVVLMSIWGLSWYIRRRQKQARAARQPAAPRRPSGQRATLEPALATVYADEGALAASGARNGPVAVRANPLGARPPRKKAGRKRRPR
jgi:hypothetical protein